MGNVLVTGGAGFMGSHIVDELLRKPSGEVVVLDDLSGGFLDNINEHAAFTKGSVCDVGLIDQLFRKYQFTHVFHLAAYAAEGLSHFIRRFNYTNNLVGSINLINAAVNYGVSSFVFTSSIAVYGKNQLPMTEDMVPQPEDPYGIAKLAVELDLRAAHEMFGLNYVIFRPHNVYGERQNIADRYRNVIGIFMNQIMSGEPMTVFGDGSQSRAFSYIGDIAPIIASAPVMRSFQNQVFNIGSDSAHTVLDLAHTVAKAMGVTPNIRHLEERNEVQHAYSSHAKLRRWAQPTSTTCLEDGIHRMAVWAKQRGPRPCPPFTSIEVRRNLPPSWGQPNAST